MRVYLAGLDPRYLKLIEKPFYVLESFAYMPKHKSTMDLLLRNNLLLDSGAFTFLNSGKADIDIDKYVDSYIDFIKEHDVEYFIELDIEAIIGLKEVENIRYKIEKAVGKQSIPVWHRGRGKEYWLHMCKEYSYVAIGGFVSNEIPESEYHAIKWMLDVAEDNNCKVHGLGFTRMQFLDKLPFYSVDSTSWLGGGRFGNLYIFTGSRLARLDNSIRGKRVRKDIYNDLNIHNLNEWIKFQIYAEGNL